MKITRTRTALAAALVALGALAGTACTVAPPAHLVPEPDADAWTCVEIPSDNPQLGSALTCERDS